jgi:hypothetical protein
VLVREALLRLTYMADACSSRVLVVPPTRQPRDFNGNLSSELCPAPCCPDKRPVSVECVAGKFAGPGTGRALLERLGDPSEAEEHPDHK